ncbi:MAG: glycosyltransferase family 2 protein [Pirellulaceae bacterium]|nr:glycosyltransferase family 2 protein [Pirellulaceae bacterium]
MSPRRPKISLGMPIYNGAAFLRETLESLLGQTYGDFELIISDNASTDETGEICQEYANGDDRIRYQRLEANLGAVANFNRLIGLAGGQYYKWVAADDMCQPTFLEAALELIESDPDSAWVHSAFGKIDQYGTILDAGDDAADGLAHSRQAGHPRIHHDSQARHQRFQGVLLGTSWCFDVFGLIRKAVLDKALPMPGCYGAEKVLLGELALWGKYRQVPETLCYQRVHSKAAGEMATREQQEAYIAPQRKKKHFAGTRLALLKGHLRSVQNVPMSGLERCLCWSVIGRYMGQVSKWPQLVRSELYHEPIRGTSHIPAAAGKQPKKFHSLPHNQPELRQP